MRVRGEGLGQGSIHGLSGGGRVRAGVRFGGIMKKIPGDNEAVRSIVC